MRLHSFRSENILTQYLQSKIEILFVPDLVCRIGTRLSVQKLLFTFKFDSIFSYFGSDSTNQIGNEKMVSSRNFNFNIISGYQLRFMYKICRFLSLTFSWILFLLHIFYRFLTVGLFVKTLIAPLKYLF